MRVAFVHSSKDKRIGSLTRYMVSLFEKEGCTVKVIETENTTSPVSLRPFDLIFVGSQVLSLWGGKISSEVITFLQGASGMEGKRAVAYVRPNLFGNDKALKRLMSNMESQGAFVIDFEVLKSEKEARDLVNRHLK
ncbi:MAG: hypothetical protein PWP57_1151 [Candidatus Atribacteria bacterium]|nr:hypothetical protein [Candidatus Atribacteria bacterium]